MAAPSFKQQLLDTDQHFIVGVAGDSGSGKTTFTRGIHHILGPDLIDSFTLDAYHTQDREARRKSGKLPLDPEINDLELLADHLSDLKEGRPVMKPFYDHATGTFGEPVRFEAPKILVIEGLHTFYTERLRELIDFKIFVDPYREIKQAWKFKRAVSDRGHTRESVLSEMRLREPLYKQYIDFQKIYADVVIKILPSTFTSSRLPEEDGPLLVRLIQRIPKIHLPELEFIVDLSTLLDLSSEEFLLGFSPGVYYGTGVSNISVDGMLHLDVVSSLERNLHRFVGFESKSIFSSVSGYINAVGFCQLLLCWRFLGIMQHRMEGGNEA